MGRYHHRCGDRSPDPLVGEQVSQVTKFLNSSAPAFSVGPKRRYRTVMANGQSADEGMKGALCMEIFLT